MNTFQNPTETITMSIVSPMPTQMVYNNSEITIATKVSEPVKKVEYFVDGQSIGASIENPYQCKWIPKNLDGGQHKLTAVATSTNWREVKTETSFVLQLRLGDNFKGGKIFYLDESGKHGLIASKTDLKSEGVFLFTWGNTDWLNTAEMVRRADQALLAGCPFKNGFEINGYSDWYIPSRTELELLKKNQHTVGNFPFTSKDAYYWSSTELSNSEAYALNFVALSGTAYSKENHRHRIRLIRKF